MIYKTKYLLATTALLTYMLQATPSYSDTIVRETVTTTPGESTIVKKTVTETAPVTVKTETTVKTEEQHIISGRGDHILAFADFDLNHDGTLSMNEVGKMLFKIYDIDGNSMIDDNEYEHHTIVTINPAVEKNTITSYDFDGDGEIDQTKYTYETFMDSSRLSHFSTVKKGISAHEFIGKDFMAVDVNRDHGIELKEWQGTYIASIDRKNKINAETNK